MRRQLPRVKKRGRLRRYYVKRTEKGRNTFEIHSAFQDPICLDSFYGSRKNAC